MMRFLFITLCFMWCINQNAWAGRTVTYETNGNEVVFEADIKGNVMLTLGEGKTYLYMPKTRAFYVILSEDESYFTPTLHLGKGKVPDIQFNQPRRQAFNPNESVEWDIMHNNQACGSVWADPRKAGVAKFDIATVNTISLAIALLHGEDISNPCQYFRINAPQGRMIGLPEKLFLGEQFTMLKDMRLNSYQEFTPPANAKKLTKKKHIELAKATLTEEEQAAFNASSRSLSFAMQLKAIQQLKQLRQ